MCSCSKQAQVSAITHLQGINIKHQQGINKDITLAVCVLCGKTPNFNDRLHICVIGSEIHSIIYFNETPRNAITVGRIFITTTINGAYNLFLIGWCQKHRAFIAFAHVTKNGDAWWSFNIFS